MVCSPSQNNINISSPGVGPSLPGLGLPFSVPKTPFSDVGIPEGVPEDLLELLNTIIARLPQGIKLVPNSDSAMKGIWDAISSIFNQLAPFLAFFKFIQALLNMVMCIIDVICALKHPLALMKAIKRLFKNCIPDFLSLFPWFSLIIMILSLILLLIAIIEYLYNVIKSYIEQIVQNINILKRAIQVSDDQAVLAAVNKISYMLCLIEQLFSMLMALAALFAIIEPLMRLAGRGVCSKSSGSSCCEDDDYCPPFIRENENGLYSNSGKLTYYSRIDLDWPDDKRFNFLKNSGLNPQREETWQFVDTNPGKYKFLDIITPSKNLGFIFWPEGDEYTKDANINRVPYLLDMSFYANPKSLGITNDYNGIRRFLIKDIIVIKKPTEYPITYNGGTDTSVNSGALQLGGGTVWQYTEDGYSAYMIGSTQATLNTFILNSIGSSTAPTGDDGYNLSNIDYTLRFNYASLVDKGITTLMCSPGNAIEAAVVNAEYADVRSVLDKIGELPDINATVECLNTALTKFRQNLNEETAAIFQSEVSACLDSLKEDATNYYGEGTSAAADRFSSDFEIDPTLQFVKKDINITIRLRDKSGSLLAENISPSIGNNLAKLIKVTPTLGTATELEYDGYSSFKSVLTSKKAGIGEVKAFLNKESFSMIINRENENENTAIIEKVLTYEFVDQTTTTNKFKNDFDQSDIAADNVG